MSGHSKWSQIKRQKGAADAKRSMLFAKLSQAIASAARQGTDPSSNFKLRLAVDKARSANMPQSNVERAIQRGGGGGDDLTLEEITYEIYGPEGVALIVNALTDNRNRTTNDLRAILNKHQATIASSGSVSWMFELMGVLRIAQEHLPSDPNNLELQLIDAGVVDVTLEPEGMTILTPPDALERIRNLLAERRVAVDEAGLELVPKTTVTPSAAARQNLEKLHEELNDLDEVQTVFTNAVGP